MKYRKEEINMKITEVNIEKVEREHSRLRGIATIIFDDLLVVSEIRVINGNRGLFVAMPAKRIPGEKFMNVVDATNKDFFKYIENTILDKFNKLD